MNNQLPLPQGSMNIGQLILQSKMAMQGCSLIPPRPLSTMPQQQDYVWGVPGAQQPVQQLMTMVLQAQVAVQQQILQQLSSVGQPMLTPGMMSPQQLAGAMGIGQQIFGNQGVPPLNPIQLLHFQSLIAKQASYKPNVVDQQQMKPPKGQQSSSDVVSGSQSGSWQDTATELASRNPIKEEGEDAGRGCLGLINDDAFSSDGACDLLAEEPINPKNKALLADGNLEELDELVGMTGGMYKVGSFPEFNLDDLDGSFLDDAELEDQQLLDGLDAAGVVEVAEDPAPTKGEAGGKSCKRKLSAETACGGGKVAKAQRK